MNLRKRKSKMVSVSIPIKVLKSNANQSPKTRMKFYEKNHFGAKIQFQRIYFDFWYGRPKYIGELLANTKHISYQRS